MSPPESERLLIEYFRQVSRNDQTTILQTIKAMIDPILRLEAERRHHQEVATRH